MAKIITFPSKDEVDHLPTTMEGIRANIEAIRHVHINEVTEVLVSTLTQQMMTGGFNILDEEHQKDFAFLIETVRSSLCKTVQIYHPFQDVSENVMQQHGDEAGVLTIADHVNVKFQDEESSDEELVPESTPNT